MSAGKTVTTEDIGLGQQTDRELLGFHERLREAGDIIWDKATDAWIVSSYELIREVFVADDVDWRTNNVWDPDHPPLGLSEEDWIRMNFYGSWRSVQAIEGPDHTRQHRWWLRAFSPKVLAEWGDGLIEPIAHEQVDLLAAEGRAELYTEYCEPVTTRSMAAVLGLPYDDPDWFARFRDLRKIGVEAVSYPPGKLPPAELIERFDASAREIYAMVAPAVLRARDADNNGFVNMLWRDAEYVFGEGYRVEDVVTGVIQAYLGATGTTSTAGANLFFLVLTSPGLRERALAGGAEGVKRLIEESLRLFPPVEFRPRRAKRDVELDGAHIKKGDLVILEMGAANRDPRRYTEPAEVDLERPAPKAHFAFAQGPRTCTGNSLARFLMERMFAVALERMEHLRLDPDAEQPRYHGNAVRNWQPLNALFDATPAA
jgi:cytochrome P450